MCDIVLCVVQTCHQKTVDDDTETPIKIQNYENQIRIRYPTTQKHVSV